MRMWIILGIVVLAILAYVFYVAYPIRVAIQKTQPLMAAAVAYQQHPANATAHVLVAGDSTAVGTGATTPGDSIAGRIGADFPNADITDIGVNGAKLAGLQAVLTEQFSKSTSEKYYDLIVLQIGANDVTGLTPLSQVQSELQTVLTMARAHASHVVVLTAGDVGSAPVFRFPLTLFFTWRTLQVRSTFMKEIEPFTTAMPDVNYVDLYTEVPASVFNADIPKYYAADHFHPSSAGYGVWYEFVGSVVRKDLATSPGV